MRWIAVTGWIVAAVFGVLWAVGGPLGGDRLRDPEADLLRDRIHALETELAAKEGRPPPEAASHPPLVEPPEEEPEPEAPPSRFAVKVISAAGLPDRDGLGKADPFVVVRYDEEEKVGSVKKGTLAPTWNEVWEFRFVPGQAIKFTVLDRDLLKHDLVGRTSLDLNPESAGRRELPLSDGGTITVEIRFAR